MDKVNLQNRTKLFAISCIKLCENLPKTKTTDVISYQLIKSATSVAANYRAACRAKSKPDFINKLKIVEEEADESLFWIEVLTDINLISKATSEKAMQESKELVAIFTPSIKTAKNKKQPLKSKIVNLKSKI
jgi:four helix bundle protein